MNIELGELLLADGQEARVTEGGRERVMSHVGHERKLGFQAAGRQPATICG